MVMIEILGTNFTKYSYAMASVQQYSISAVTELGCCTDFHLHLMYLCAFTSIIQLTNGGNKLPTHSCYMY